MNPDYRVTLLTCVTKNNVSYITGEDGSGNLTAEDMIAFMNIVFPVALFLPNSDRTQKAIEICSECLILLNNTDNNSKDQFNSLLLQFYSAFNLLLFRACCHISDYIGAERYGRKLLVLYSKSGDLVKEGYVSIALAEIFESQNRFTDAKQLYEKAVYIKRQTGEKIGEASACASFGIMLYKLGKNLKAKEYAERALAIATEIGDRGGEASCNENLGALLQSLGQYSKAKEYLQKALVIKSEIGDIKGEASCYGNLGTVFHSLGQNDKAKEYLQKALAIKSEIGDRKGEAS